MATAHLPMNPAQKHRPGRRANLGRKPFSQAVPNAVDLYLDSPVESEAELHKLAKDANQAAGRLIKNVEETVACIDRQLESERNGT
jgi:translation elongation factor EF-G